MDAQTLMPVPQGIEQSHECHIMPELRLDKGGLARSLPAELQP